MVELGALGVELQSPGRLRRLAAEVAAERPAGPPPPACRLPLTIGLRSRGEDFGLRFRGRLGRGSRGLVAIPTSASPASQLDVIAALVLGEDAERGVEIEGDRAVLESLREMVVLPERLREEARADFAAGALVA